MSGSFSNSPWIVFCRSVRNPPTPVAPISCENQSCHYPATTASSEEVIVDCVEILQVQGDGRLPSENGPT